MGSSYGHLHPLSLELIQSLLAFGHEEIRALDGIVALENDGLEDL